MRLFIAINFTPEIKSALKDAQKSLKLFAPSANYSHEQNFHLTLAFIGESNRADDVKKIIASTADSAPFPLTLEGAGRFGDIVWIGVKRTEALCVLADKLSAALRLAGFNIETHEFKPHITIAREVTERNIPLPEMNAVSMTAGRVSLMKSERINGRLTYTEIYGK